MRFQNSPLEARCNKLWNNEVVTAYKLLSNYPQSSEAKFFAANYPSIESLTEQYCQGVLKIITNVERQTSFFEDQLYIAGYMNNIDVVFTRDFAILKTQLDPLFKETASLALVKRELLNVGWALAQQQEQSVFIKY